jgi:hypothetical protein
MVSPDGSYDWLWLYMDARVMEAWRYIHPRRHLIAPNKHIIVDSDVMMPKIACRKLKVPCPA